MAYTVRDFETNFSLAGAPSEALTSASLAVLNGAAAAYLRDGIWVHVPEQDIAHQRSLGREVRTVYVD